MRTGRPSTRTSPASGAGAEEGQRRLRPPGAAQPGQADDFAGPDGEADVFEQRTASPARARRSGRTSSTGVAPARLGGTRRLARPARGRPSVSTRSAVRSARSANVPCQPRPSARSPGRRCGRPPPAGARCRSRRTPRSRQPAMTRTALGFRRRSSAAVGSSKRSARASSDEGLGDLDQLLLGRARACSTGVSAGDVARPTSLEQAVGAWTQHRAIDGYAPSRVSAGGRRRCSRPPRDGEQAPLLEDDGDAESLRRPLVGEWRRSRWPSKSIRPASGR